MEIPTKNLSSIAWLFFSVLMFASSLLFHGGIAVGDYKTLPIEVDALNSIFRKWNIPYKGNNNNGESWNINSTNPCNGFVVSNSNDESINYVVRGNLQILCLCDSDTFICNIIKLAVWDFDIVGTIPNELQNLTKLVYFDITYNSFSGELPAFLWSLSDLKMMYENIHSFFLKQLNFINKIRSMPSLHRV
ncbi:hypothetical protein ZOSMA_644G00010 [Zostera marina]|uniref:Uncharacterized protein n=1 Tax=Zostera marina TaxID=29655 RepID=A0A0K9NTB6_ZOSMR|nr:hypothetical protein ZOSMA_644G00010 [Zostera marina]